MTVNSATNRNDYTAAAAQTVFPFTFVIYATTDLLVYVNGTRQTLGTDYAVAGVSPTVGGNVTFASGLAAGDAVAIVRSLPYTQDTSLPYLSPFPEKSVETALDRATIYCQQLLERLRRTLGFGTASALTDVTVTDVASCNSGSFLQSTGTGVQWTALTATGTYTNPITTLGDLVQGGVGGVVERLVAGAQGALLRIASTGKAAWLALGGQGTLLVSDGIDPAWQTCGSDGEVLSVDSASATALSFAPHLFDGTARLTYTNPTTLTLGLGMIPLRVGGVWKMRAIPAAVTVSNVGLTACSLYYVYAVDSAGSTALEVSATGHSPDAAFGVEVQTGDPARTLVGMAYTASGVPGTFAGGVQTLSYFKRRLLTASGALPIDQTTQSNAYVQLGDVVRVYFATWADDAVHLGYAGAAGASANQANVAVAVDDGANVQAGTEVGLGSATASLPIGASTYVGATECGHFATLVGKIAGAVNTLTVTAGTANPAVTTLTVTVRG